MTVHEALEPELFGVPVPGGELAVARWGSGPVVLAAHGITGNHRCWVPLVRALGPDVTLVAPDLRGRGASAGLGGPYGMARHADDLVAVLDHLGVDDAVVVGHSMGGFVAGALAAGHPARVQSLLLVDGGLPIPVPPGLAVDELLLAVIGPAMERLLRTFTSWDEYEAFWRAHPAFAAPDAFTDDLLAYLRYDLGGTEPSLRSRTDVDAVRGDSEDTLDPAPVVARLDRIRCPIAFLRAERGMLDQPGGLYPEDAVAEAKARRPEMSVETIPAVNHYTIILGQHGADVVAARIAPLLAASRLQ